MRSISNIAEEVGQCQKCGLCGLRNRVVPGEGAADAKVMFVGEAPGRDEDLSGRPFVGQSGRLLRVLIRQAGIDPREVFITSVLKCRPPGNRNPTLEELEACQRFLDEQIEILNPRVIVPLGNFACRVLIGKTGITGLRGECFERAGVKVCPTFHPAAAIRDASRVGAILEDLKRVKELL